MTDVKHPKSGEIYFHYKNPEKFYEIVCIGKDKETLEDLVVYRALYPVDDLGEEFSKNPVFVRKLENFCEILEDGTKRFTRTQEI